MIRNGRSALLAIAILILRGGSSAAAQHTASTLDELMRSGAVRIGDKIYVTGADEREFKGTLASLTPDSVAIDTGMLANRRQTLSESQIRRITRADTLLNGLLIGLGAGMAVAAMSPTIVCDLPDPECAPRAVVAIGLPSIGGGAAIGALLDRAIRRTVYRNDRASGVSIMPIALSRVTGLTLTLRF